MRCADEGGNDANCTLGLVLLNADVALVEVGVCADDGWIGPEEVLGVRRSSPRPLSDPVEWLLIRGSGAFEGGAEGGRRGGPR